jgi:hypothetical protein
MHLEQGIAKLSGQAACCRQQHPTRRAEQAGGGGRGAGRARAAGHAGRCRGAGCARENVTVEAGKTYRLRVINVGSLTYQVRARRGRHAAGHSPCERLFTASAEVICGMLALPWTCL